MQRKMSTQVWAARRSLVAAPLGFAMYSMLLTTLMWGCSSGSPQSSGCKLGEDDCPEGYVCLATETAPQGRGVCMEEKVPTAICVPGGTGCQADELCWPTADGKGACLPADSCTLDDGKECQANELCWDSAHTPAGVGTCVPNNSCTLDGTWACLPGEECRDMAHALPGLGTCAPEVPEAVCTEGGKGEAAGCAADEACWPTLDGRGQCMPEDRCVPGGTGLMGCALGQSCKDTAATPPGQGICAREDACVVDAVGECQLDEKCEETPELPEGLGLCETIVCTRGGNECPQALKCVVPKGQTQGSCVPDDACTLDALLWDTMDCIQTSHMCWDTDSLPDGLGRCVPDDACTLDSNSHWENKACAPGKTCLDIGTLPGLGTCT